MNYSTLSAWNEPQAGSSAEIRPRTPLLRRLSSGLSSLLTTIILLLGTHPQSAQAALCSVPQESGSWVNSNSAARNITRVKFRMYCENRWVVKCVGSICSGHYETTPHYYINVFGSCSPTDCNWGEVEGRALTGSMAGWYYFYYNQGFAKRHVYVRTYPAWPGWLRVWIHNDFTDPARADYTIDEWFRH